MSTQQQPVEAESSVEGLTRREAGRWLVAALGAAACRVVPGFAAQQVPALSSVMTVRGPVKPKQLGFTLPHEHVLITHIGPAVDLTDEDLAARELGLYRAAGGRTLVCMTNIGIKRDPPALRRISDRTDLQIVMGAGFYKDKWQTPETRALSTEALLEIMLRDLQKGADGTEVRAGVLGEIGVGHPRTEFEERVLRAAARAQRATGVGMIVHFDIAIPLAEHMEALDILESEGASLTRVAISHLLPADNGPQHLEALARRGCFLAYDFFGIEVWIRKLAKTSLDTHVEAIRRQIDKGLLKNLLFSQDVCSLKQLVANGGYGYAHIIRNVLPKLRAAGVTAGQIDEITVQNPRRLLAGV
ncbi:MAG: hypothetical protein L0387_43775 [Acidobacteria bacterium]|nr:hypothetical protein [Acidobacteriota bacterium]MCI0723709.1 hypothetical protein [Acidobacteriota bacterium]